MTLSTAIKTMMEEHQYILHALKIVRKMCKTILDTGTLITEDFFKFIDFVRNFADKYHHGKEEAILFKVMEKDLGATVKEGPIRGMLVEHDLGRLYMSRLEEALHKFNSGEEEAKLDIIANTISYTHLLNHHINTEDNTLYPFASRELKPETMAKMEEEVLKLEEDENNQMVKEKYINLIKELEKKYN